MQNLCWGPSLFVTKKKSKHFAFPFQKGRKIILLGLKALKRGLMTFISFQGIGRRGKLRHAITLGMHMKLGKILAR